MSSLRFRTSFSILFASFFGAFILFSKSASAVDPAPGAACALNLERKFSGGPELSGFGHWLVCIGGVWQASFTSDGSALMAVGTTSVATGARMEIAGGALRLSQQSSAFGGEIQFAELLAQGTNTVALRARGTLASSLTWLLPDTLGTAGNVMTVGAGGTLYWSSPSGSVTYPLLSTTYGSVATPAYSFSADPDTGMYSPGTGTLAFSTNGTLRLNIGSDGRVGIGTNNPGSKLEVVESAASGVSKGVIISASGTASGVDATGLELSASSTSTTSNTWGIRTLSLTTQSGNIVGLELPTMNSTSGTGSVTGLSIANILTSGAGVLINSSGINSSTGTGLAAALQTGAIQGGGNTYGVNFGNISTATANSVTAFNTGNLTSGGPANGINIGAISTSSSSSAAGLNINGVSSGGSVTGVNVGALTSTGASQVIGFKAANLSSGGSAIGLSLGTLSNASVNTLEAIKVDGVAGSGNSFGVNITSVGTSVGGTANAFGINLGAVSAGTGSGYGVYIGNVTTTGSNPPYSIYAASTTAISHFGGNVGIGTTAVRIGNRLEVTGGAVAVGNGGEMRMMENLSQGTNFVAFKARGTLGSDLTWLLPDSLGTAGNVMTVGTGGTLYWSAPSGAVTYPLLSTTLGSVATPAYSFSTDTDTGIYSPAANQLAFSSSGTARIFIRDDGRVGVGTTSPQNRFHVGNKTGTDSNVVLLTEGTNNTTAEIITGSTATQGPSLRLTNEGPSGRIFQIYSTGTGNAPGAGHLAFTDNTAGQTRMVINPAGSVGIGTTNPGSLFHVDNNLGASSVGTTNVAAQLSVRTTAATVSDGFGPALLFSSSINGTSYSYGRIESIRNTTDNNTDLVFKTANSGTLAEKVRISSGGAFGIGITPFSRFHVRSGTSGSSVMRADAADSSTLFEFTEAAAGYGVFAISNSAGTPTISFSAVGNSFLNGGSLGIGTIAVQAGNQLEVTGGAIAAGNGGEVRMMENLSQGTNFVAFKARGTLSTDLTWLLPDSLGTAGQVMTVGTGGTLYWANSGGSVSYPLLSTTRGSVATPAYSFNSDTDTGLFSPGTGTLALSTNGTSRIYIDALGNIGFNSSDPDSNISFSPQTRVISVTGDGSANASSTGRILLVNNRATATSGDSLGGISFHSQNNSTGTEASIGAALEGAGGGGGFGSNIQFFTKTDNVAGQTERMRLTGQGALGIGTTAPPALLAVSSSTTLAAGTTALNSYLYTNPSTAFTGLSKAGDFQSSFDGTATSSAGQLRGLEGGAYNFSSVRLGNAEGVVGYIQNSNTGSIDNATALEGNTENTSTGTIGNAFGLSLTVSKGPGVITTAYGIYTGNIQSSTGNSYSFYASDATARSYFAGTVGVGTTSPDSSLQVNGTFRANSISSSSGTAAIGSINFSNGNAITSSTDCTGAADQVKLANIRDGGSYTLVVTGTGTALCDFDEAVTGQDAGTVTYRFSPTNAVRTGSSHTVYTMIRVGNIIYISWITGF